MALLKQSTLRNRMFLLVRTDDHITGKTGAAPTLFISKDGGAFVFGGGVITEVTNGWYEYAYTAGDVDTLGDMAVHVVGTDCDPTDFVDQVVVDLPGASVTNILAGGITQADLDKVFGAGAAAMPELLQGTPTATPTPAQAMMLLYMSLRDQSTSTATTYSVTNNAGTVIAKSTLSDDGTTFTRQKMVSGP